MTVAPFWLGCVVGAAVVVAGCGGAHAVGPSGFHHLRLEYRVPGAGSALAGDDWVLDNYRVAQDGSVGETKRGAEYRIERRIDLDGDGVAERVGQEDAYDLLFRHRTSAASMWIRTVPLPAQLEETELRVLMRFYVEAIAGTGVTLADLGEGRVEIRERRYATREIESGAATVGGREARAATIEIADIDQLRLSADHRWQRARIVLVRTDLLWAPARSVVGPRELRPVLLIAGYTNLPEDFDGQLVDFEALLARVDFDTYPVRRHRDAALQCVPGAAVVRVYVGSHEIETPDAEGAARECIQRTLAHVGLAAGRSYGFRRVDTMLSGLPQLGSAGGDDAPIPLPRPPDSPFDEPASEEPPPGSEAAPMIEGGNGGVVDGASTEVQTP